MDGKVKPRLGLGFTFFLFCVTLLHRNTQTCGGVFMGDRNLVNITITLSKIEKKMLKQMALDRDMSVSALIREWIFDNHNDIKLPDDEDLE